MFVGKFSGTTNISLTYSLNKNNSKLIEEAVRGDLFRVKITCMEAFVVSEFSLIIEPEDNSNQVVRLPVEEIEEKPGIVNIKGYRPIILPVFPSAPPTPRYILSTGLLGYRLNSVKVSGKLCFSPPEKKGQFAKQSHAFQYQPNVKLFLLLVKDSIIIKEVSIYEVRLNRSLTNSFEVRLSSTCGKKQLEQFIQLANINDYLVLSAVAYGAFGQIKMTDLNIHVTSIQPDLPCFPHSCRKQMPRSAGQHVKPTTSEF